MSAWVLVCDAARARVFEAATATGVLREIAVLVHPEGRLHAAEAASDEPGVTHDRVGQGVHAMSKSVDFKEQEAIRFATEVASAIRKGREERKFERLYVVAPPKFLGQLRSHLDDATQRMVVADIDKDLSRFDAEEIRARLPARL